MAQQTLATPDATPAASPVGSPVASPIAAPYGTPVAAQATPSAAGATGTVEQPGGPAVTTSSFSAQPMGFYTDTSVCIGCKACEVACKEWNQLSARDGGANLMSGLSYDNTRTLDGEHWRHVKFIEQFDEDVSAGRQGRWLMMSDVCKHCVQAGCLEVCPTGAIIRTEFDTVVIQADVCNGCRDCIAACPYGVIDINPVNNTAMKCTLCYDRMQAGLTPACAQACPTASIQFGPISELQGRAQMRLDQLQSQGVSQARLYGHDDQFLGGLNSFYLLLDEPEIYGLPSDPKLPGDNLPSGAALSTLGALAVGALGAIGLRKRRMDQFAAEARAARADQIQEAPDV